MDKSSYDFIVVGAGFSGAVAARELAERRGRRVLVLEKKPHIGGSAYDRLDETGILIHLYGPHIFHTNNERVWEFLSRFTEWLPYEHRVLGFVRGMYLPIPFNLDSTELAFGAERGAEITKKLLATYGENARVSITELRKAEDPDLRELAEYVFINVFLYYTMKQWGITPDKVDQSVLDRVPVVVSRDDRYFADRYQGMPKDGYTKLFERILDHPNITVELVTDALPELKKQLGAGKFETPVIYTGALDELFGFHHGKLPYRTLWFDFESLVIDRFQPAATVNYTVSEDFTRITEFKQLTGQILPGTTSILREYSEAYEGKPGQTPFYPINSPESDALYRLYQADAAACGNLYPLGRLAQYKYYNMDAAVAQALSLIDQLD